MHEVLKVEGMTCGGCVRNVAHALKALAGVGEVKVSLPTGQASVEYDERLTSPAQMRLALKGAGYGVEVSDAADSPPPDDGCCG